MTQAKLFTVAEANAMLPVIKPLMASLVEKRAKIVVQQQELGDLLADLHVDVGGPDISELTQAFDKIERLIQVLQGFGVVVKDINVGLLDFPAQKDGHPIFLCWRYGEEQVAYYHGLNEGYNGRSPLI